MHSSCNRKWHKHLPMKPHIMCHTCKSLWSLLWHHHTPAFPLLLCLHYQTGLIAIASCSAVVIRLLYLPSFIPRPSHPSVCRLQYFSFTSCNVSPSWIRCSCSVSQIILQSASAITYTFPLPDVFTPQKLPFLKCLECHNYAQKSIDVAALRVCHAALECTVNKY